MENSETLRAQLNSLMRVQGEAMRRLATGEITVAASKEINRRITAHLRRIEQAQRIERAGRRQRGTAPAARLAVQAEHLTRTLVDQLQPVEGKSVYVWDDDPKALAVRVLPSGRKVYVVRMVTRGKQRWVRIGEHGQPAKLTAEDLVNETTTKTWIPETARVEAKRLLGLVAGGADPSEAKRLLRGARTLAEAARDYIADQRHRKRPATLDGDCSLFGLADLRTPHREIHSPKAKAARRILDEPIASSKLPDIRREDIEELMKRWRSTPYRANRALALLSHLFKCARIEPNPCKGIERNHEEKRKRYLTPEELTRLGKVLAQSDEDPRAVACVRLLLFTGARRSEVMTLEWQRREGCSGYVDLAAGKLCLFVSKAVKGTPKTVQKDVLLPPPALAVLKTIKRKDGNPHVFAGDAPGRRYQDEGHAWESIRKAAGIEDCRLHDLRHTAASFAISGGASLALVGGLLGHADSKTTERYAHLMTDPLRAVADRTAGEIEAALKGKPPARVLSMTRRRRA